MLFNSSVNDLDDRKFILNKPANEAKLWTGRYAAGYAKQNLKFSTGWRKGMAGASETLTRTGPKSC